MNWQKLAPVAVAVAVVAAYHNSLTVPFIFDDYNAIVENPHVRQLWPVTEAMAAPSQSTVDGRPVVALSLALNYALGRLNVTGYHLVNVGVHLLNALLLFGIIRRTPRATPGMALAVAMLWAVHPLATETVNYVVQRTELLMALFLLLTVYCFSRGWHIASVAACAVGMGCKEVMVVTPVVMWLYDRTFLGGTIRQRRWYYAGLAATWLVLAAWNVSGPRTESLAGLTAADYARTQFGVIVHYLRLAVWPAPLVVDYDDWPVGLNSPAVLVIVALVAGAGWGLWRKSWLGFAGAWFFVILAPSSSVVPIATELAAERRMYLPLAAVVVVFVVTVSRWRRVWLLVPVGLALLAGTILRNEDYRTQIGILTDTVTKRPSNARALANLGTALVDAGRVDDGIARYREALRVKPGYDVVHFNLGQALARQGRLPEARDEFVAAVARSLRSAAAHSNLGRVLAQLGDGEGAARALGEAVRLQPGSVEARCDYGSALARLGWRAEAAAQFAAAVRLDPTHEKARRLWEITTEADGTR